VICHQLYGVYIIMFLGEFAPRSVLLFANDYYYFPRCVCARPLVTSKSNRTYSCIYINIDLTNQNWPVCSREKKPQTIYIKIMKGTRGEKERERVRERKNDAKTFKKHIIYGRVFLCVVLLE